MINGMLNLAQIALLYPQHHSPIVASAPNLILLLLSGLVSGLASKAAVCGANSRPMSNR